jgi:hypothetical protein
MRAYALASCLLLAGCGALTEGGLQENAPGVIVQGGRTPAQAEALVHAGQTRDEVRAALGDAKVIAFDSGWQVWVYRWPGADASTRAATELVILFEPSGKVRKVRLRPGVHGG